MTDIFDIYNQLCKEIGIVVDPEFKVFTVEHYPGGAIAIIPGKPTKCRQEIRATINCDPETIKTLIREVLAEAF